MKSLPFCILLLLTFGQAGLDKLFGGPTPTWFLEQFHGTLLDLFPGSLSLSYYGIMTLELVTAAVLAVALIRREFLGGRPKKFLTLGIILSQVIFIALGFGLRLTHKFDGAAQLFFYAALTYIGGYILTEKDQPRHSGVS